MVKSLYVMSDTHDDLEAVARAVDFAKSEGREGSRIVHVGDFALRPYTRESLDELMKSKDLESFLERKESTASQVLDSYKRILDGSGMPWVAIPGNYDGALGKYFGERDIHGKATDFDGLKVIGYGGAGDGDGPWIGPPHMGLLARSGQIQLFDSKELSDLLTKERPTIAVIHNPPHGLCDDMYNGTHVGNTTTTNYLQNSSETKLVLSGHIHEAGPGGNNPNSVRGIAGIKRKDESLTFVVNPGNLGRFDLLNPQTLEPVRGFDYGTFVRVDVEDDGTPVRLLQYSVQDKGNGRRSVGQVRKIGDFSLK